MEVRVPSTMLSSSTTVGRIFGQGVGDECLFDITLDPKGQPAIMIRIRGDNPRNLVMPAGSHLLVQLFEQPEVLWLAHATKLQGEPFLVYAPIEPLQSADGRCEIQPLAEVSLAQVDEGVHDAMNDRERSRHN